MQRIELEVAPRDLGEKEKKRNLNQLRSEGWIPAVIYGHGDSVQVAIESRKFFAAVHNKAGVNALFNVKLGKENTLAIIKEVQKHFLTHKPIHVDILRINVKEELEMTIPVHTIGEAPGVKNSGGILETITREIRVRCLPDDIPASIDVDVSKLELGHGIKVKDVTPLKGVEILTAPETIVVNVVAPKVEEEKPAVVEGAPIAGAEPEVIAKGKKEEEGAAPAAGAAGAKPAAGAAAPAAAKGKEEKKK